MSYVINRTTEESRHRRYISVTIEAATMDEALTMDQVLRLSSAADITMVALDEIGGRVEE